MSIKPNSDYPIFHWAATIGLVGPLIFMIECFLRSTAIDIDVIMLFIPFGLIFSLPLLFIYGILFYGLAHKFCNNLVAKIITNAFVILGIFLTFYLIGGSLEYELSIVYSISAIIASCFFKIDTPERESISSFKPNF